MPEAGRRRRAPPSQIQITFTLRAKDQFSKERGRKRRRRPRGSGDAGRGERRALARGGRRERREGEGAARGPRSRRGREGGAGGRRARARDAPEIHGQGGLNGRAAPAGRPLGSCYTARAAAAAQPRRRAHAARRGARGHDYARGGPQLSRPARSGGPAWGRGSSASRGRDLAFPRATSRPALARPPPPQPDLEGPGQGGPCAALRPAGLSLPAPGPSRQLRRVPPSPPLDSAHRTRSGPASRDLAHTRPWAPSTRRRNDFICQEQATLGEGGSEGTSFPSPARA